MPRDDPPELEIRALDERSQTSQIPLRIRTVLIVDQPSDCLPHYRPKPVREAHHDPFYVRPRRHSEPGFKAPEVGFHLNGFGPNSLAKDLRTERQDARAGERPE